MSAAPLSRRSPLGRARVPIRSMVMCSRRQVSTSARRRRWARCISNVAQCHHRRRDPLGQPGAAGQPGVVAAVIARRGAQVDMARIAPAHRLDMRRGRFGAVGRGQGDQDHPRGPVQHIAMRQPAIALVRPSLAQGQQPGQALIGGAVGRQGDPLDRAVGQHQPAADDQPRQARRGGPGQGGAVLHGAPRRGVDALMRADRQGSLGGGANSRRRSRRRTTPVQAVAVRDGRSPRAPVGGAR